MRQLMWFIAVLVSVAMPAVVSAQDNVPGWARHRAHEVEVQDRSYWRLRALPLEPYDHLLDLAVSGTTPEQIDQLNSHHVNYRCTDRRGRSVVPLTRNGRLSGGVITHVVEWDSFCPTGNKRRELVEGMVYLVPRQIVLTTTEQLDQVTERDLRNSGTPATASNTDADLGRLESASQNVLSVLNSSYVPPEKAAWERFFTAQRDVVRQARSGLTSASAQGSSSVTPTTPAIPISGPASTSVQSSPVSSSGSPSAGASTPRRIPAANVTAPDQGGTNTLLWLTIIILASLMMPMFYLGRRYERRYGAGNLKKRFQKLVRKLKTKFDNKLQELVDRHNAEVLELNQRHNDALATANSVRDDEHAKNLALASELAQAKLSDALRGAETSTPQLLVTGPSYFSEIWDAVTEGALLTEEGYAKVDLLLERVADEPAREALNTLLATNFIYNTTPRHSELEEAWKTALGEAAAFTPENIAALPQLIEQKYGELRARDEGELRDKLEAEISQRNHDSQQAVETSLVRDRAELDQLIEDFHAEYESRSAQHEVQGQTLADREQAVALREEQVELGLEPFRKQLKLVAIHFDQRAERLDKAVAALATAHPGPHNQELEEQLCGLKEVIAELKAEGMSKIVKAASDRPPPLPLAKEADPAFDAEIAAAIRAIEVPEQDDENLQADETRVMEHPREETKRGHQLVQLSPVESLRPNSELPKGVGSPESARASTLLPPHFGPIEPPLPTVPKPVSVPPPARQSSNPPAKRPSSQPPEKRLEVPPVTKPADSELPPTKRRSKPPA